MFTGPAVDGDAEELQTGVHGGATDLIVSDGGAVGRVGDQRGSADPGVPTDENHDGSQMSAGAGVFPPESIDQLVGGHRLVGVEQQPWQQAPTSPGDLQLPRWSGHSERTEHGEEHAALPIQFRPNWGHTGRICQYAQYVAVAAISATRAVSVA